MKKYFVMAVLFMFIIVLVGCEGDDSDEMLSKKIISSENAPAAIGPYSQAVMVGNTLYCSGQIAIDPATGKMVEGDVQAETHQVLKNLGAVLKEAGMDYKDAVRATVFMDDMDNYGKINEVYAQYFTENPPARAAVQVARLPTDVKVEISLVAVKTGN
jgi:2-iminobutanoate/2-iminopropanoate deaminase